MPATPKSSKARPLPRATTLTVARATAPPPKAATPSRFIKWFADISIADVPLVGGKNASLGEMYRELASKGVKVPNGFAITAEAYRSLLREAGLEGKIRQALAGLDTRNVEELRKRGSLIRNLILGVDRDSEIVAPVFDERNPAVKKIIAQVIAVCRAKKRKIGICGQAPSDYPDFAQFLVEQGIDSISLNPDTVLKTTVAILKQEESQDTRGN